MTKCYQLPNPLYLLLSQDNLIGIGYNNPASATPNCYSSASNSALAVQLELE